MSSRRTLASAREKLCTVSARYELLVFIPGLNKQSTFYDKERELEFTYYFGSLVHKLSKDSSFVPRLSKEDLGTRVSKGLNALGYNPGQTPEARAKRKATIKAKYSSEYYFQSKEFKDKYPEIQDKIKKTCFSKLGVENPLQSEEIREKIKQTCILQGTLFVIKGKTIKEWASKTGRSISSIKQLHSKGIDVSTLGPPSRSSLETILSLFLDSLAVKYVHNKRLEGSSYRPDFLLPDHKLIVECDGLYWHSDSVKTDKNYHKKKKEEYAKLGYKSLFFREDEILTKLPIVEGIILNALGVNKERIFARKCSIKELESSFFAKYHLMGKGVGRSYGLFYQGKPVAGIQVKWVNKDLKLLEISRFCSSRNTSVVGGFSKLLEHVKRKEQPHALQTFIDRRYGVGSYLPSLGFEESTTYLSFKWTDYQSIFNRMQYRGSTGYQHGLAKIWDCGQTKFVLNNST